MSVVIVNATAAKSGGALSILNQFVDGVAEYNRDDHFIVFVDLSFKPRELEKVRFVPIDTRGWRNRVRWDKSGFKNWLKSNSVMPDLIISLQNTGVNYSHDVSQLIYYHQLLAIAPHKWNPFRKNEFVLFCYKNFYQYFVRRYLTKNTHVVVQMPFIKDAFLRKFKVPKENVHVISPKTEYVDFNNVINRDSDGYVHFIYPAASMVYKNHVVLLKALYLLKKKDRACYDKIRLHFTLRKGDNKKVDRRVKCWELEDVVVMEGCLPFPKLLSCYKNMDALLFPSYIETVGLPLLEAAGCGMAIKAADLPYAHEVLQGYQGVSYVNYQDERAWAEAIEDICRHRKRYVSMMRETNTKGWKDFFELVNSLKKKEC